MDAREIHLNKGLITFVDADDYDLLNQYHWFSVRKGLVDYVCRTTYPGRKRVYMHRLIMGFPDGPVDHLDGNGLDNRKVNLRACSNAENRRNRPKQVNNKSGYKGVYWHKQRKRWNAKIRHNHKNISLGLFDDPQEAHQAYLSKAAELWGEDDLTRARNEQRY